MIARNILFNVFGGLWALAIAVATVPLQTRLLGMESYGVVGFLASLQIIVGILDLGLPTMVIRKVASEGREAEPAVRATVGLYLLLGTAAGGAIAALAPWLCDTFLSPHHHLRDDTITAMRLSALALAVRWPVAVYSGLLTGLQRMRSTNLLKAGGATVRNLGVCAALLVLPDIRVFAGWMVLVGALELAAHMAVCRKAWPGMPLLPRFGLAPLAGTWAFSAGMLVISAQSILLTQSDRLVVAHFRPLLELGHYSAAYAFAFSLAIFQGFITSALLPVFAACGDGQRSAERREAATEVLMLGMSIPAVGLALMGESLLRMVMPPADAIAVAAPLGGLALGSLITSSLSMAITDSIAKGRVWGIAMLNLASLPFYLTVLVVGVSMYGIVGAAIAWLILNLSYLVSVPLALDRGEDSPHTVRLLLRCSVPFWLSAFVCLGAANLLLPPSEGWRLMPFIAGGCVHLAVGWFLLTARTRSMLLGMLQQTLFPRPIP